MLCRLSWWPTREPQLRVACVGLQCYSKCVFNFNKFAIQDKEAIGLPRVHSYYSKYTVDEGLFEYNTQLICYFSHGQIQIRASMYFKKKFVFDHISGIHLAIISKIDIFSTPRLLYIHCKQLCEVSNSNRINCNNNEQYI